MDILLENSSNSSIVVTESENNNSSKLIKFQSVYNDFFVYQDRVEVHFFGLDNTLLFSNHNLTSYKVPPSSTVAGNKVNELTLDPVEDALTLNFRNGDVKVVYNFLREKYSNTLERKEFFIDAISPDRTEIRAFTNEIVDRELLNRTRELKEELLGSTLDKQFILNFNNNNLFYIVNIDVVNVNQQSAIIIKLFNPLPEAFLPRDTFYVEEVVSDSVSATLTSIQEVEVQEEEFSLRGPNFDIQRLYNDTVQTEYSNIEYLESVKKTVNEKGIKLGIDYTNFENFIYFSSAEQRVLNYLYKINNNSENLDHFEKYLNEILLNEQAIEEYLNTAIEYDNQNNNKLTNAIPSFIAEDGRNQNYILFIDMIGQHFDDLWIYSKAIQDRYNGDNRVDIGLPKELLTEAIRTFGFSLPSSDLDEDYLKEIKKRIYHNTPFLAKSKGTETGLRAILNCFGISDIDVKVYENIPFSFNRPDQNVGLTTSSLDRIDVDNDQDPILDNLLSQYTQAKYLPAEYDSKLPIIEVGFSSTEEINKHIKDNANNTDVDSLIGDYTDSFSKEYSDLKQEAADILALANFNSPNLSDLVRSIKIYDNALFKTIEQFIPERSSLNVGLVVKPHILERSKANGVSVKWNRYSEVQQEITGSNYEKNFQLQFGIPIGEVEAGDGGSFFASYDTSNYGIPKFNGELEGTVLEITSGELNSNNVFKYFLNTGSLKFEGSDFDTFYGNVNKSRLSLIREHTEDNKVEFQDSTYEDTGWANARFRGSKSKEKIFEILGDETQVYQGETLSKNYPFFVVENAGKGFIFNTTIKSEDLTAIANGTLERPDNVIQTDIYFATLQRNLLVSGNSVDTEVDYNITPIEEQKTHFTDFYQIQATDQKLDIEQIFSSLTSDDDYYPPFQEGEFTYYASKAKTFLFRKNNTTNTYEKIPNSFVFILENNTSYQTDKTGKILGLTQEIVANQPGGPDNQAPTYTSFNLVNGSFSGSDLACSSLGNTQRVYIGGTITTFSEDAEAALLNKIVYTNQTLSVKFTGNEQYWYRLELIVLEEDESPIPIKINSEGEITQVGDLCSSNGNIQ